jgi:hypothetical protein
MMNDFEELNAPKQSHLGWYVVTTWGIVTYLHDDGKIHTGTEDRFYTSSGYFPSEYEAHKCAERYYLTNCRKYPYGNLLNASQKISGCSEVMEFES